MLHLRLPHFTELTTIASQRVHMIGMLFWKWNSLGFFLKNW